MLHSMLGMALAGALLLGLPLSGMAAQAADAGAAQDAQDLRLDALATRIERNDDALGRQEARIEALSAKLFETLMDADGLERTAQRMRSEVERARADRPEPPPPAGGGSGVPLALILGMLMPIGALLLAPRPGRPSGAPVGAPAGPEAPLRDPTNLALLAWLGAGLGYALVGFGLMFAGSPGGWLGTPSRLLLPELLQAGHGQGLTEPLTRLTLGLPLAGAVALVVCSAVPGRLSALGHLLAGLALGALVYPLFGHWAGAQVLGADNRGWLAGLGFADPGGTAGIAALAGGTALALAARLRRGEVAEGPDATGAGSGIGAMILWLAWLGIALTASGAPDAATLPALVLGTAAGAAGTALALLIPGTLLRSHAGWERLLPIGLLAGAVAGSGAYAIASALDLVLLGLATGALYNVVHRVAERRLGAPAGLAAGLAVAGACGTLAPPVLGSGGSLSVQLIGLAAALGLASVAGVLLAELARLPTPPGGGADQAA